MHSIQGTFKNGIAYPNESIKEHDGESVIIAFLIHERYIPDPEQLNQQRFKCAAQMREPLYYLY